MLICKTGNISHLHHDQLVNSTAGLKSFHIILRRTVSSSDNLYNVVDPSREGHKTHEILTTRLSWSPDGIFGLLYDHFTETSHIYDALKRFLWRPLL